MAGKPKGWRKDSARHGLAAKGIKTKQLTPLERLTPLAAWIDERMEVRGKIKAERRRKMREMGIKLTPAEWVLFNKIEDAVDRAAEREKDMKKNVALPKDLTQMTRKQNEEYINVLSKLSLKELRRRQIQNEGLIEKAFQARDVQKLKNFEHMFDLLMFAVDKKEFGGR